MIKKILIIVLLLLSRMSFSQDKIISIVYGSTYIIHENVIAAYPIPRQTTAFLIEIKNNKAYITPKFIGKRKIQILNKEGVINYEFNVISNYKQRNMLGHGTGFFVSGQINHFGFRNLTNANNSSTSGGNQYVLNYRTALGVGKSFSGYLNHNEWNNSTIFYNQFNYKDFFIGQGTSNAEVVNSYFLQSVQMNLIKSGFSNSKYRISAWKSKGISSNNQLTNLQNKSTQGFFYYYNFNPKNTLDFSIWSNDRFVVPSLGFKNMFGSFSNRIVFSNANDKKMIDLSFMFSKRRDFFSLYKLGLAYSYAPSGITNFIIDSNLVQENIISQIGFGKFSGNGSLFFDFYGARNVLGFSESLRYGTIFGWNNSKVFLENKIEAGILYNNISENIKTSLISPSLKIKIFEKNNKEVKIGSFFSKNEFSNGEMSNINQKAGILSTFDYKKQISLGLAVGRNFLVRNQSSFNGHMISPNLTFKNSKFKGQINANWIFGTKTSGGSEILLQRRLSVNLSYKYKTNHQISLNASDIVENINFKRNFQNYLLSYSFSFGDPNKSILSVFNSLKISGFVFLDANSNGKIDEGEKGYSNKKIYVNSRKGKHTVVTDEKGFFEISGLDREFYQIEIPDSEYSSLTNIPDVDLATSEGFDLTIPLIQNKLVKIEIKKNNKKDFGFIKTLCDQHEIQSKVASQGIHFLNINGLSQNCEVFIDSAGEPNVNISPSRLDVVPNQILYFIIEQYEGIKGQYFFDMNKNDFYDFGEELVKVKVIHETGLFETDFNGSFFIETDKKYLKIKDPKGFECFNSNGTKELFLARFNLIKCKKSY